MRSTTAAGLARTMRVAGNIDQEWRQKIPEDPAVRHLYLPWMPFPVPAFLALLFEALPLADGERFLEIGCGPGSKLLLARDIAGLNVYGIDRDAEMTAAARTLGLDAETADAAGWDQYGAFQLIWFNRPFRDPSAEEILEKQVWRDTAPGTVVICANLEHPPPGWKIILDDWERRRGIWVKPAGA